MSDNYAEETRPLFKMLRTEAFRFVIVRYNHFSLVRQLEKDLQSRFPDRPFLKIDAQQADYHSLTQAYFSIPRGFLWVENFGDILKERRDTQGRESEQDADENERRRGITAGLNLRRDKLAKSPIALFVLIPAATDELYARIIMEKMPDLWSFRSMILDLEQEGATATSMHPATGASDTDRRTVTVSEDTTELKRLLALLDESPETETAYRLTLYPQIVTEAKDTGKYDLALSTLDTWESQAAEQEKAWIWIEKGDILRIYGHLEEALPLFVKAKDLAEQYEHKNSIALSYERMGDTYTDLGNLKEALICFEQYNAIEQDLANLYPSDTKFKNNLAISYSKLGSTHTALGNLPQALTFFEQFTELMKELHDTYPQNVSFKNGLAISYEKLGETHTALGNLPKALIFFEQH
ncbi:MAG TPA: tetratricopeptide repeat protein, partial [Saprospiraceae bacterium]|nr:tetratricopeptide repeat protein [Saprospiraceae bacterium]